MKDLVSTGNIVTPILFPYDPQQFWQVMRMLIREEMNNLEQKQADRASFITPGMTYKPLFKINEVCELFHVTKPTIYDWIKHGKLKPFKVRSRVYFLWQDIQALLHPPPTD
jgi:excisionase family DNA binding protein